MKQTCRWVFSFILMVTFGILLSGCGSRYEPPPLPKKYTNASEGIHGRVVPGSKGNYTVKLYVAGWPKDHEFYWFPSVDGDKQYRYQRDDLQWVNVKPSWRYTESGFRGREFEIELKGTRMMYIRVFSLYTFDPGADSGGDDVTYGAGYFIKIYTSKDAAAAFELSECKEQKENCMIVSSKKPRSET